MDGDAVHQHVVDPTAPCIRVHHQEVRCHEHAEHESETQVDAGHFDKGDREACQSKFESEQPRTEEAAKKANAVSSLVVDEPKAERPFT